LLNWQIFEELTQVPGAPGFEQEVRRVMHFHLSTYTTEIVSDRLGGIFAVKHGNTSGPKVMVAGHMDEVAFLITKITAEGFLKFQTLGGWWSQVMLAQRVDVVTRSGEKIPGVIGSIPPHLLSEEQKRKPVEFSQMFIDIGAKNDKQVQEWGIFAGDVAVPYGPFTEMEGGVRILSKAWDNRFGCGMAIELLAGLQPITHPNTVYAGATVQEEVGLRGAGVAAHLIKPDVFFAVDAGPAADTPGTEDGFGRLGKGVLIRLLDRTLITSPEMREFLISTAEAENIPYQLFISQGGTDAGAVQRTGYGVPSATIGICARYIHSHTAIADKEDMEATKALIVALVKRLDRTTYASLLGDGVRGV
jgi:putative aminopeptidase FrvX